jgi:hypothetical protein
MSGAVSNLKPVEQDIVTRIAELRNGVEHFSVVLEGGYFTTAHGVDEFTIQSQRSVFRIARQLHHTYGSTIKVIFGILANDLGQVCESSVNVCLTNDAGEVPTEVGIPTALQEELNAFPYLHTHQLIFQTERRARNRGLRHFRKYYESHSVDIRNGSSHLTASEDENEIGLYLKGPGEQHTAVAKTRGDWQWSSYCPLIMAQHYADISQRARKRSGTSDCVIIDLASIEDRHKVDKGAELALASYSSMRRTAIMNVCFGDDTGELYVIDEHRPVGVRV